MRWYEFAENPETILALYDVVPSLKGIDLQGVVLHQEDASMTVIANLSKFVDRPPAQWIKQRYNATMIKLDFFRLEALLIDRWSTYNLVDADIERVKNGNIRVEIISSDFHIQAIAHSLRITVNAFYQNPLMQWEDY